MSELFDWYTTKAVKNAFPEESPYPYDATKIQVNSRILVCGTTGSRETQALLHYIRLSPGTFSKVFIYTKEREVLYDVLIDKLTGSVSFSTDLGELPSLKQLRELEEDPTDRMLVVIDDYMTTLKRYPHVADYFIYGRKKNITLFCLAQNYYTVPKELRSQMTYLLLFTMVQQKDIKLIISEFDTKDKQLLDIYTDATREPLGFLKLQTGRCPINERFSKGFTNFYRIKDEP
jgi:hypothetical protein